MRTRMAAGLLFLAMAGLWGSLPVTAEPTNEEAKQYVQFVEELEGACISLSAKQIQVKNIHPSRKIRVWLDRYHMGTGTGDRSKSDLLPGAAPEPLGCSRSSDGPQEWRVARAAFIE